MRPLLSKSAIHEHSLVVHTPSRTRTLFTFPCAILGVDIALSFGTPTNRLSEKKKKSQSDTTCDAGTMHCSRVKNEWTRLARLYNNVWLTRGQRKDFFSISRDHAWITNGKKNDQLLIMHDHWWTTCDHASAMHYHTVNALSCTIMHG